MAVIFKILLNSKVSQMTTLFQRLNAFVYMCVLFVNNDFLAFFTLIQMCFGIHFIDRWFIFQVLESLRMIDLFIAFIMFSIT